MRLGRLEQGKRDAHGETVILFAAGGYTLAFGASAVDDLLPPTPRLPQYVTGLLSLEREIVQVINLGRLISSGGRA